jgi:hypothetical protein
MVRLDKTAAPPRQAAVSRGWPGEFGTPQYQYLGLCGIGQGENGVGYDGAVKAPLLLPLIKNSAPLLRRQRDQARLLDPPHRPTPNIAPSRNVAPTDPLPMVHYDANAGERSLRRDALGSRAVLG